MRCPWPVFSSPRSFTPPIVGLLTGRGTPARIGGAAASAQHDLKLTQFANILFGLVLLGRRFWDGQMVGARRTTQSYARALPFSRAECMHSAVRTEWSVAGLAQIVGVSRSVFAARFADAAGCGPCLARWRMALAKDALISGIKSLD